MKEPLLFPITVRADRKTIIGYYCLFLPMFFISIAGIYTAEELEDLLWINFPLMFWFFAFAYQKTISLIIDKEGVLFRTLWSTTFIPFGEIYRVNEESAHYSSLLSDGHMIDYYLKIYPKSNPKKPIKINFAYLDFNELPAVAYAICTYAKYMKSNKKLQNIADRYRAKMV